MKPRRELYLTGLLLFWQFCLFDIVLFFVRLHSHNAGDVIMLHASESACAEEFQCPIEIAGQPDEHVSRHKAWKAVGDSRSIPVWE